MSHSQQPTPVFHYVYSGRQGSVELQSAFYAQVQLSVSKGFLLSILIALLTFSVSAQSQTSVQVQSATPSTCPDLTPYYPAETALNDWLAIEEELQPLMQQCLENTEYFALLGAAQLNNGNIGAALETLERSLLLEPRNGAAQIDYAQALFVQGQLFSALALNEQLLLREDLPEDLQPVLQERQDNWQAMTRQTGFQADILVGYDSNLNGAPTPDQITLTLSGESINLPLGPDFRPVEGPYLNLRLSGRHRQLTPDHQHNLLVELRGRVSEDTASDLLQLDTRYAYIKPGREHSWQVNAGLGHLMFGGSPLYTATEVSFRYMPESERNCRPYLTAATQYQLYHNQSKLNAIESKAGGGYNCPVMNRLGNQQVNLELSLLSNLPIKSGRPGSSRYGWQVNLDWQLELPHGVLSSQINHTQLDDKKGYSTLLADGAARWISRSYVLLQYRQPWRENTTLLVNLYHQEQRSNIELFRSNDSTVELGLSIAF